MTPKERAMSEPAEPVLGGETRDRLEAIRPEEMGAVRGWLAYLRDTRAKDAERYTKGHPGDEYDKEQARVDVKRFDRLLVTLGEVSRLRERVKELEGEEVTGVTGRPNPAVEGSPDP